MTIGETARIVKNDIKTEPEGTRSHKAKSPVSVACCVVVSSDSRNENTDTSGKLIKEKLITEGHKVLDFRIIKDEPTELLDILKEKADAKKIEAIIISGGTGIGKRDSTYETLCQILERRLDGFGELFRLLSYEEIGSAAIMSRAVAGVYKGMIIFAIPGSLNAAQLALEKLILPEIGHAVHELNR